MVAESSESKWKPFACGTAQQLATGGEAGRRRRGWGFPVCWRCHKGRWVCFCAAAAAALGCSSEIDLVAAAAAAPAAQSHHSHCCHRLDKGMKSVVWLFWAWETESSETRGWRRRRMHSDGLCCWGQEMLQVLVRSWSSCWLAIMNECVRGLGEGECCATARRAQSCRR